MSNRDSLGFGELIPRDVVDIFAHEKQGKRGRKKRSHSLGRALGWLKGKKRKDLDAKGLGLGPALDLALDGHRAGHKGGHKSGRQAHPQGHNHAVPKQGDDEKTQSTPLRENVFVEGSRPQYLENLHTEALEGLKMMQEEETNNGVEYQDNESTISTTTVQTDGDGFMTDSTIADTSSVVSVKSSVSTRSSRSGLTRQASTFRPLNSGKKSDKAKTRRRHRKPSAGIPQHVQRELGLDRVGWILTQRTDDNQFYNGDTDESPTTDGPQQAAKSQKGASRSLQNMNVIHPLNKEQLDKLDASNAGHRDDLALLHRMGPDFSGAHRPRSLAVPWMTTTNSSAQEPPSPVMSISPQAPYMSKIIPNAVLPPSIDVVEISRGRSRNSVRTVSKSSLLLSSPAPSRASCRTTSSRSSNLTSASQYNTQNVSDSSCWSNSESSDTLVSDSSTISRSSTPRQMRTQDKDAKEDKISVHSSISKASKSTSNGTLVNKEDMVKTEGQFARSHSIMKAKKAPPPPNRSYSLHNKMKRRSRDLAEVRVVPSSPYSISAAGEEDEQNKSGSSPISPSIIDSPGYNADTSSLEDSPGSVSLIPIRSQLQAPNAEETGKVEETEPPPENTLSNIVSPSSGYSSQDGTPAQLSKQTHSSSPRHKRGILAKLQRLFPGSSPTASPVPPLTQPADTKSTKSTEALKPDSNTASVSPSVRTLRDLFNIPPPPIVHAPPPPPPEVWAHSKRSVELLLGPPVPDNLYAIIKKNPKDRRQQRQSPSALTKNPTLTVESVSGSMHVPETKTFQESRVMNAEIHKENNARLAEQNVDLKGNNEVTERVEKVRVSDLLNGMLVKAVEKRQGRLSIVKEEEAKKTSTQAAEIKTNKDSLPAILLARTPPSPSPPLVHHPPQPPAKQIAEVVSDPSVRVVVSPESSWPPPPPALVQVGLNGPAEIDIPLPPPPMFSEQVLVLPVQVPPVRATTGGDSSGSISQGTVPPTVNIPPPPSYSAPPPPPTKDVSPPPPPKEVLPPPPPKNVSPLSEPIRVILLPPHTDVPPPPLPKDVSPPPPKEVSPPPPPKEVSPPPPPKEVSPPPPKEVFPPPPPKNVSPPSEPIRVILLPPPKEVSPPPPPKEVSPPPPKEVSPPPPPPKEVSPPPPPKEVSPPPPPPKELSPPSPPLKEVSPPPPPKEVSPPPPPKELSPPSPPLKEVSPLSQLEVIPPPLPKEVSPPPPEDVSPPPPPEDVSPPPLPKEVSPPPSTKEVSPAQMKEVFLPPPKQFSPPSPKEVSPPPLLTPNELPSVRPEQSSPPLAPPQLFKDIAPTLVTVGSLAPVKDVSPPQVITTSPLPPKHVSTLSTEEVSLPSSEEAGKLGPPLSIPPPPPKPSQPQSLEQENDLPQESIPSTSEPDLVSCNSILAPPQSIPPPPQMQVLSPNTDGPATQDASPSPPFEASIPPSPEKVQTPAPSLPANVSLPPPLPLQDLASIEHQPSPASTENQTPECTSAPVVQEETTPIVSPSLQQSAPSSPEPPKAQGKLEDKVMMPSNEVQISSASCEAPQKPIRRSLIITSPTSTFAPSLVGASPLPFKIQSLVVPTPSSSTALSPTKKSPPAMATSPSMNLQEAIRLRTAARSKDNPSSRLSLQSQTSPIDFSKSPTSTASFVFSKSNKKVVIETKSAKETKATIKENLDVSSVTKVPPPVAKKPKTKGKEIETSEGTEEPAGQEALQESIKDAAEKTNGTAGTVGGAMTST